MKYLPLLFLLWSFSVYSQYRGKELASRAHNISIDQLKETEIFLASNRLKGRKLGSTEIEEAAQYLIHNFVETGLKPYYQTYRDSFPYRGETGYNIIAYKPGSDTALKKEFVILSAHYDHIGTLSPVAGDSIANGANDDASGTAAVLALAHYFAHKKTKRPLLFVLFSGEEEGLIGSTHLANRLKRENIRPYFMIEFEMIGVPMKNKTYLAYLTGYRRSNLGEAFNSYAGEKVLGNSPVARKHHLFFRSDNAPFYRNFHIPAQTISSFNFSNFHQYHQVGDEVGLLDFSFMKRLLEACLPGIEGLINTPDNILKTK